MKTPKVEIFKLFIIIITIIILIKNLNKFLNYLILSFISFQDCVLTVKN